ncbi:MAG: DUF1737 domain-containing protein [Ahrensia sp.]|nr:DUF1737 domain-containing protein [Ahrensia sp.]
MKLYRLISGPDDSAFCNRVSKAISAGWDLHGSPALSFDSQKGTAICAQAVVKDVPEEDYRADIKLGDY